jgi:hypothetical protein
MRKVSLNQSIKLKVLFTDYNDNPVDPSQFELLITKPDQTQVNIIDGFTRVELGFYYIDFSTTDLSGIYKEEWIALIDGVEIAFDFEFEVTSGGKIINRQNKIDYNQLILITIDESIEDVDGNLLGETEEMFFCTEFNPFYAPIEMLRVECGTWMNDIPDDTLALAIHWSSIKANQITCKKPVGPNYYYARTRFVLFDAAISLFTMPVGSYGSNSKTHKTLGDLSVQNSDLDLDIKDLLKEYKEQREEWFRVVNAGGHITLGQSLGPTFASKSAKRPDHNLISRQWHDPWNEYFWIPTNNSKYRKPGEEKYKSGFTIWNYYYFTTSRLGRNV